MYTCDFTSGQKRLVTHEGDHNAWDDLFDEVLAMAPALPSSRRVSFELDDDETEEQDEDSNEDAVMMSELLEFRRQLANEAQEEVNMNKMAGE